MQTDRTIFTNDNQTDSNTCTNNLTDHAHPVNHPVTQSCTVSPPKKRRKRGNIGRYSRPKKRGKPNTWKLTPPATPLTESPRRNMRTTPAVTLSPPPKPPKPSYRPTPTFFIPTPKTLTRKHPKPNHISIDEYLENVASLEELFGEDHRKVRNLSIAYTYRTHYGAPPPSEWGGRNGTICRLAKFFRIPNKKRRQIARIIAEVWECIVDGRRYDDDRKLYNRGRMSMIEEGGGEEAIIADWMEQGLGFRHTLIIINQS